MQCQPLGQSTLLGDRIIGEHGSSYRDTWMKFWGCKRKPGELEGVEGKVAKETIHHSASLLSTGVLFSDYCILKGMLSQDS